MATIESPTERASSSSHCQPKGYHPGPCQILEPARKTIQMLEAQRIMAVLENTINRLQLVMALQQVLQQLPRFQVMLGSDLVDLLECHETRQQQFKNAEARLQRKTLKIEYPVDSGSRSNEAGQVDSEKLDEHWLTLNKDHAIARQGLKYSLLDILRYFKKNPKAVQLILGLKLPCAPAYHRYLDYMDQLQTIVKDRLLTLPADEQKRRKLIVDILTRERKTNAAKVRLETKYSEAVRDKESEISKRNAIIAQLKSELSMLDKMTHDQQRKTVVDAARQCSTENKSCDGRKVKMREEMFSFVRGLRDHRREHREVETTMRKRTFKIGTEVFNWVQKYDADMGARQDEYDRILKLYETEKVELTQMAKEFTAMEAKYEAILEEKRKAAEAAKRREEEIALRNFAATRIQAVWKGFHYRLSQRKKAQKSQKTQKKGGKKKKK